MRDKSEPRVLDGEFMPFASGDSQRGSLFPSGNAGTPFSGFSSTQVDLANPQGNADALGEGMLSAIRNAHEGDAQYVKREKSFFARMLGKKDARDRRIEQHELAQTSQVCTFLEKKLTLECDAIYERCKDDVNNWLAHHRIASRRDLITFATAELQGLRDTIETRREAYTEYLRRREARLSRNRDIQFLVDAELEDMRTEMEEHLAFLRGLEEHFRQAIQQKIG